MSDANMPEPQCEKVVYHFVLFVAGDEPNSVLARRNLEEICQNELLEPYELDIVNVFEDHSLALKYRVLVTPCLVMLEPSPSVMIAGTLQDTEKVRRILRLK